MLPTLLLLAQIVTAPVTVYPHGSVPHREDFGNHSLSVTIHDKSGVAEIHELTATVMIVQSGEATLIYGGEMVDPKTTAPHEIRAASIRNGITVHVSAGDVVHFAAGVPHQWLVEPGHQITYLVVHIEQEPTTK